MWTRVNDIDRMFGAMDLLRSRMNRLFTDFDRSYGEGYGWQTADKTPSVNLYDLGEGFELKAEVPGLTREDLHIKLQGNYLEISGTKKSDTPEGYKAHRIERSTATFTRSFTLPADVDGNKVSGVIAFPNRSFGTSLPCSFSYSPRPRLSAHLPCKEHLFSCDIKAAQFSVPVLRFLFYERFNIKENITG